VYAYVSHSLLHGKLIQNKDMASVSYGHSPLCCVFYTINLWCFSIVMDACIMPMSQDYSKYLFYSSFSIGLSSMISLSFNDYITSFMMFLMFLLSIQFWYKPEYGFRRNIDMLMSRTIAFYYLLSIGYDKDEICGTIYLYSFYNILFLYLIEMILVCVHSPKWIVLHMAMHLQLSFMLPFILYIL
jgi:hypothetical protein